VRVTIIVHEADEAPVSFDLSGRSAEEIGELHDQAVRTLALPFIVAQLESARSRRPVCTHGDFSHGVPESGIRSRDCVERGTVS